MSTSAAPDPAVGLGQIQAADPTFDVETFKRQAVQTFLAVKQSIEAQDLAPIVDQLSDRMYDGLRLDVSSLQARDAVQHYEGLAPTSVVVAAANRGADGDAITLRIQAVAAQFLAPAGHGGWPSVPAGPFTEFWTFTRPPASHEGASGRLECPNCGAPIDIDTGRVCRYCKALLPSRQTNPGWVVAAIQPAQENPA